MQEMVVTRVRGLDEVKFKPLAREVTQVMASRKRANRNRVDTRATKIIPA